VSQCPSLPRGSRQGYRYRGPYLEQLTLEAFRRDPRPWRDFFGVGAARDRHWRRSLADSYNVPDHLTHLKQRLEENIVYFLVRRAPASRHRLAR
jgi:hypothetical protein